MEVQPVHDVEALRAWQAVDAASHDHDHVGLPADPIEERLPLLDPDTPHAGEITEMRLGVADGRAVGVVELALPTIDNLASCSVTVLVHPDARRCGHGRALLRSVLEETAQRGRPRVFFEVPSPYPSGPGAAEPLLREVGARPVLVEVRRLLDLTTRPAEEDKPVPANGYRVVQWVDRAPDELVEDLAGLVAKMSTDAPQGDMDWEPERWDAARYRDKEASAQARGRTRYATAVVHAGSGRVVAMTDIGVSRTRPEVAYQWDTIVDGPHRGHGLGLVVKAHNHALLRSSEPSTRWVNTWNAESNTHMVAINDLLGFEPVAYWTEWQLDR